MKLDLTPVDILVWAFVMIFITTAVLTFLALIDNFKYLQIRDKNLKALFGALLSEIVAAGVAVASGQLSQNLKNDPFEVELTQEEGPLSAGALVYNCNASEPKILMVLVKVNNKILQSPSGGKSVKGEEPFITAKRETLEETGIRINPVSDLGKAEYGNTIFSLILSELDTIQNREILYNGPISSTWVNPNNIPIASWVYPEQREWIIENYDIHFMAACSN